MPEGDTVWRAARKLQAALAGVPITDCQIRWGSRPTPAVIGRETLEVVSRGKHLLHRIDGGITIHSHFRMEGSWRVIPHDAVTDGTLRNRQIRALVATEAVHALGLRLGMLDVIRSRYEAKLVGHLGPDVLGADWDADRAIDAVHASDQPIGAALLDQRHLAGVGTMYCAETLFLERIPPWTPASDLSREQVSEIVVRAYKLLQKNKHFAIQSTTGSRMRGEDKFVHARSGLPCRRCGTTVRVAMIGTPPQDRTMFYCLTCQGGVGPTDDGRRQTPLAHRSTQNSRYRAK